MAKRQLCVSVIGPTMSGKTTVMKTIMKALTDAKIEVEPIWGPDGPPFSIPAESEADRLKALSQKTKVTLTEFQVGMQNKKLESPDAFKIRVYNDGPGFSVSVMIAGVCLSKMLGATKAHQERARAIAARFAAELGVEVEDSTRNDHEWVQQQKFEPTTGL